MVNVNETTRRWRRRGRALTLVELMLSLAATGLVGAAIASMMSAVTYGTASRHDIRAAAVRHKTTAARVTAAIRESTKVLACGDGYIVLWLYDFDGDEAPSQNEIQRIELDVGNERIRSYVAVFPDAWDEATLTANNTVYDLTDDFDATTPTLRDTPYWPATVWAPNGRSWTPTCNTTDCLDATLVSYRLTVRPGDNVATTDMMIGAAALRNGS